MHDAKNNDPLVLQEIDNPVASEKLFTQIRTIELRDDPADVRRFEQGFGRFYEAIDEGNRMGNGITGNKGFDVLQIVPGSQRPATCAIARFSLSTLPG